VRNFEIPFVRFRYFFVFLSLLAVLGSTGLILFKGLNYGVDFKGGIKLQYQFDTTVTEDALRKILTSDVYGEVSLQRVGLPEEGRFAIKLEQPDDAAIETLSATIQKDLKEKLNSSILILEQEESVGPKAGKELRRKGQLALIVSWVLMLIYIGYRFDFYFSPGAILALIHDVLITLGCFALTGRQVSLTTVAALLTIIGYSINDTIIIYDRVRENLKKHFKMPLPELVNLSMNQTLSRTIITSLTVFFVVIILYLFGEGEIEGFGFAMIIGVITGTYSTLFVATQVYLSLKKWVPRLEAWQKKRKK